MGGEFVAFAGPEDAKAGLMRGETEEGNETGGTARRDGDENAGTMNERTGEAGPALVGGIKASDERAFVLGDAAEVENLESAETGGLGIPAADAEEGHGDVFGDREGRQEAGLVEEEAESLVAELAGFFGGETEGGVFLDTDAPGIRRFEQAENVKKKALAAAAGSVETGEGSRREGGGDVADLGEAAFVPLRTHAGEGFAGESGKHGRG